MPRRLLGEGGFGLVYEAYDRRRKARVALKLLKRRGPEAVARFKAEFRSLVELAHPNLVALHELVTERDSWFFTMELVEGADLLAHLRGRASDDVGTTLATADGPSEGGGGPASKGAARRAGPCVAPPDLAALGRAFLGLACGVRALHEAGKLHRDIKPANVLVERETGRVVLVDFGLVQALGSGPGGGAGTPFFMAPEQAGGESLTEAADWYAVGGLLYEALTGLPPFSGTSSQVLESKRLREPVRPRVLVPSLPEPIDELCVGLLRREPRARPGGAEIVAALERLTEKRAPRRASVRPSGGVGTFVGREAELGRLRAIFADVVREAPAKVRVSGESGVGKTSLCQAFVEGLDPERALVLRGRCYRSERVPYQALDDMLDALASIVASGGAPGFGDATAAALGRAFPALGRVLPAPPAGAAVAPGPEASRRLAWQGLRDLMRRAAGRRALVLWLDDLQWADDDSVRLLRWLLGSPPTPSTFFVASERPGGRAALPFSHAIDLGPLGLETSVELARRLLGPASTPELARGVASESAGNPFWLGELARDVASGGARGDVASGGARGDAASGGARGDAASGGARVGVSLGEALGRRLEGLDGGALRLLEIAAVAGRPLPEEVGLRASDVPAERRAIVNALVSVGLLRVSGEGPELDVYHERVREAVLARLGEAERRGRHLSLARVLERTPAATYGELAAHLRAAGEGEPARRYFVAAAEQAERAFAFDRAAALYGEAIEGLGSEAPRALRGRLADALARAGHGAEAAGHYALAAEGADRGEALELRRRGAEQLLVTGRIDEGARAMGALFEEAGIGWPSTRLGAIAQLAWHRTRYAFCPLRLGPRAHALAARFVGPEAGRRFELFTSAGVGLTLVDPLLAASIHTRALTTAPWAGDGRKTLAVLGGEVMYVAARRADRRGRAALDRSLAELDVATAGFGDPVLEARAGCVRGVGYIQQGRFEEGVRAAEGALGRLRDSGLSGMWETTLIVHFLVFGQFYLGRLRELRRQVLGFLDEAESRGNLLAAVDMTTFHACFAWLVAGRPDEARARIAQARGRWSQRGYHLQHYYATMAGVNVDLYERRGFEAYESLVADDARVRRSLVLWPQGMRIDGLFLRARAALAALASGPSTRPRLAREAGRCASKLRAEATPWARCLAALVEGALAAAEGPAGAAPALLERAASACDAQGLAAFAASARLHAGALAGGASGGAKREAAAGRLRDEGAADPERLAHALLPLPVTP